MKHINRYKILIIIGVLCLSPYIFHFLYMFLAVTVFSSRDETRVIFRNESKAMVQGNIEYSYGDPNEQLTLSDTCFEGFYTIKYRQKSRAYTYTRYVDLWTGETYFFEFHDNGELRLGRIFDIDNTILYEP